MIKVKRIGHATMTTADLDRQIEYYQNVVGLSLIGRDAKAAYLATEVGQLAVVLEAGARANCARLAFEVARSEEVADMAKRLSALGIASQACSDPLPGVKRLLTFSDSKGTTVELFAEWDFIDVKSPAGVVPNKLGHVAFCHPDPKAVADFYEQTMGFRVSDWIGDYFVFMRCGTDHHTVNFLRNDYIGLQHYAFELRDSSHLYRACDVLGRHKINLLWGPVRHGPGHNLAMYHRNPDDQIVELFCDLDRMEDEELGHFEPRPWHRDRPQKPKVWDPKQPRDIWGLPPTPEFLRPSKP